MSTFNKKGLFITFEGGEGSGKSTQSKALAEYLKEKKIEYILTREIGGTEFAEHIRQFILSNNELAPATELSLINAARIEHIKQVILPALDNNIHVICDRFIDSTIAYQGQILGKDLVINLHKLLCYDIWPDITFFMNIEPVKALQRAFARGDINKFENKDLAFHCKVYSCFKTLAVKDFRRIYSIDAEKETRLISNTVFKIINNNMNIK